MGGQPRPVSSRRRAHAYRGASGGNAECARWLLRSASFTIRARWSGARAHRRSVPRSPRTAPPERKREAPEQPARHLSSRAVEVPVASVGHSSNRSSSHAVTLASEGGLRPRHAAHARSRVHRSGCACPHGCSEPTGARLPGPSLLPLRVCTWDNARRGREAGDGARSTEVTFQPGSRKPSDRRGQANGLMPAFERRLAVGGEDVQVLPGVRTNIGIPSAPAPARRSASPFAPAAASATAMSGQDQRRSGESKGGADPDAEEKLNDLLAGLRIPPTTALTQRRRASRRSDRPTCPPDSARS
jgi:hypothetical protein